MANDATAVAEPLAAPAKPAAKARKRINVMAWLTESGAFKFFILACIVVNSLMLGYDAHFGPTNPFRALIEQWNTIFLYVFTVELFLEFIAQGPRRYARQGWNWFDVIIVGVSWASAAPGVTALRAFRVIRVFRLVSNVPQMQRVVEALVRALPGIFATISVLAIVFYIGAIMATTLFGAEFPERFGDLMKSGLVLFQLTLFDDWGNIVAEVGSVYPWAWAFFLAFTILSAFAVLNLFIGVIVDAVQEARSAELTQDVKEIERDVSEIEEGVEDIAEAQEDAAVLQKRILDEVRALRAEMGALRGGAPPPA
jgi:voltage-gated sodium channel